MAQWPPPLYTPLNHIQPIGTYICCGAHVTYLVTFSAAQTSTGVKNSLKSVKELGTSYNDSGILKCFYLRGGVSACESIEIFLSNELVVMANSYLEVSWWITPRSFQPKSCRRNFRHYNCYKQKFTSLRILLEILIAAVLLIEAMESLKKSLHCSTVGVKLCCGFCYGCGAISIYQLVIVSLIQRWRLWSYMFILVHRYKFHYVKIWVLCSKPFLS